MNYNGSAEYWFYKCIETGPSMEDKIFLRSFSTPAFREAYVAYEWATLLYFKIMRHDPKDLLNLSEEYIIGGLRDGKDDKRIRPEVWGDLKSSFGGNYPN